MRITRNQTRQPPLMFYRPKYLPKFHDAEVNLLKFKSCGSLLASAATDGTIRIWSMLSQCVVASCDLPMIATALQWIEPSPNSSALHVGIRQCNLVIGLSDGFVVCLQFGLDPKHLPAQSTWSGHQGHRGYPVRAISILPGMGRTLVVTCGGDVVMWWAFENDFGMYFLRLRKFFYQCFYQARGRRLSRSI